MPHSPCTPSPPSASSGGAGTLVLTIDGKSATLPVLPDDIYVAAFNRFGFVTPWIDGNGQVVYLDDVRHIVKQWEA